MEVLPIQFAERALGSGLAQTSYWSMACLTALATVV